MGSYRQYCGLAKALDVVGDRWSMLILRELLSRGPLRYTDLRAGLPGIATNLLATRLRDLEKAGVVRREAAPPPIATTLFHLTPRGEAIRPALVELGKWGVPLLAEAPEEDVCRGHWLAWPVELYLRDRQPDEPPLAIQVYSDDEPIVIETAGGSVRTRVGRAEHPAAVLRGSLRLIGAVLMGTLPLEDAVANGLQFQGDVQALHRLQPSAAPP